MFGGLEEGGISDIQINFVDTSGGKSGEEELCVDGASLQQPPRKTRGGPPAEPASPAGWCRFALQVRTWAPEAAWEMRGLSGGGSWGH